MQHACILPGGQEIMGIRKENEAARRWNEKSYFMMFTFLAIYYKLTFSAIC